MSQDLLTIGEFADLAGTTKRTILWYEEKGILKPYEKDSENGYRFYKPSQIIDFQAVLLVRKLNFSIKEIKSFLSKNKSPQDVLKIKKKELEAEISSLEESLKDTEKYYANLKKTGTHVNPKVRVFKPTPVYYIDKIGPYKDIGDYFDELKHYFVSVPKETLGLTIYEDIGYQPKKAKTKICFIIRPGLKLKPEAETIVKKMTVPKFKALSYTHNGSSKLLSMLWQELKKYKVKKDYKEDKTLPFEDLELSKSEHSTEMLMPIL